MYISFKGKNKDGKQGYDWKPINLFTFSGGEPHFSLKEYSKELNRLKGKNDLGAHIRLSGHDMNEVFSLALLDSYFVQNKINYSIVMDYLPFARQDRLTNEYEPFSLSVFAKFLNSLSYGKLYTLDVHSNVSLILIDYLANIPRDKRLLPTIKTKLEKNQYDLIVSPDKGAFETNRRISKDFIIEHLVCDKKRSGKTNQVSYIVPHRISVINEKGIQIGHHSNFKILKDKRLLVLDDICDGGGTFIALAQSLQKYQIKQIDLYVTHGIFSKGKKELKKYYKNIYALSPAKVK